MNSVSFKPSPAGRFGEAALWCSAALVVLAAHMGGGFYLMQNTEMPAGDNAPPPAIMIELAPEPEAVKPEETQIAEQQQDSEEIKTDTPDPVEPLPETPPEEVTPPEPPPPEPVVEEPPPEPEPVQEVTETVPEEPPEPQVDPIVEEQMAALDNVEVPLPTMRPPEPVEKKPEPVKKKVAEKPRPKKQVQASKASQEAKVDANKSDRTAAQQTSASSSRSSSMSPQRWQSRLAAHLEKRKKRYPPEARSRGEEGTVYVRFQIDNGGNVLSVSLSRSSGSSALDQEVLALIKRASPVPAPPPDANKSVTMPMKFKLN